MNISTCYCRNRKCRLYGLTGKKARLTFEDWHRGTPRFRCDACDTRVSARTGTAYAGIRTDEVTYRYAVTALAEGLALRATGRMFGLRYLVQLVAALGRVLRRRDELLFPRSAFE